MALAMDCRMSVLPAFGGETIRPRWPLPIGATRSMTRGPIFLGSVSRRRRSEGYSGTSLRELDAVLELLGRLAVDRGDADQGVELLAGGLLAAVFAFARCTDGADDGVALAQVVLLDLGEGDVDVVRARQVTGGADERVVLQHVQDAGDGQQDIVLGDLDVVDVRSLGASAAAVVTVAEAVVTRGVVAAVLLAALVRSLRSRRLRRFRRLPPSASSLSRVLSRRVSRVPASRRGRHGCGCRGAGRLRWPASLRAVRCARSRCSRCSARCSRCSALSRCSVRCSAAGCSAWASPAFWPAAFGALGCGFAAAAVAGARLACAVAAFGAWQRQAGLGGGFGGEPRGLQPGGGGCLGGGRVTTPSLPARRLRPRRARVLSWAGASSAAARWRRAQLPGPLRWETVPLSLAFSAARAGALLDRGACAVGGNGGDQITLAHAGTAGDTQLAGEGLELGELEAGKAAALGGCCR